ncbi:MAG: hypothetical protein HYU63_07700, partial [Armatimonadetes bacterium]|nr:hypothetical protein [Armatimonadota bacterium]
MTIAALTLNHLDQCPLCDGKVFISVKIKEGIIKELHQSELSHNITFTCDQNSNHYFIITPEGKLLHVSGKGKPLVKAFNKKIKKIKAKKESQRETKMK